MGYLKIDLSVLHFLFSYFALLLPASQDLVCVQKNPTATRNEATEKIEERQKEKEKEK